MRGLALAHEFHQRAGCRVEFAIREGSIAVELIAAQGYAVHICPAESTPETYGTWFRDLALRIGAVVVLLDVRDDLPRWAIQALRDAGVTTASMDDPTDRRLDVDLVFYPPVPQVKQMDWTGCSGQYYAGWEWVVLSRGIDPPAQKIFNTPPTLLVSMGGSDPADFTLKTLDALRSVGAEVGHILLILGRGYRRAQVLDAQIGAFGDKITVFCNVRHMNQLMARADAAITSFGVTGYELACMKVPALYLCLTENHARSATSLCEARMGVCAGLGASLSSDDLARVIQSFFRQLPDLQRHMHHDGSPIDGCAAARITDVILGLRKKKAHPPHAMALS